MKIESEKQYTARRSVHAQSSTGTPSGELSGTPSGRLSGTLSGRLDDASRGELPSEYILPFLWMHGEPHDRIKEEIDAIYSANIREFCVESRTHQEFGQERWWTDMGFILEYARRLGMRVWLLDDKFFPTGYANAYISTHPELKRVAVRMEYRDFAGPRGNVRVRTVGLREGETFAAITAFRQDSESGEYVDLTGRMRGGMLYWDVPEGFWRIFYVIRTTIMPSRPDYIDMLSPESCRAMIDAVYQPHYDRFSEYFGNTFAGFFSDEPCFANDSGTYLSIIGERDMMLPYRDELCVIMGKKLGKDAGEVRERLPELFPGNVSPGRSMMRWAYMDAVTELYRDNFSKLLGEWSRAHGVQYIGHVIEDANTHQRLGNGAGHYFRAVGPMDMAGIDIVLNQFVPGMTGRSHSAAVHSHEADPCFFNYLLAALPSSLARIEPRMKGRAMCEIFGAFGWAEGVPMMKKMLDHMLVSGINHFVPHAFSPKFPDPDCPPHFYAGGRNAQFPAFGQLMNYMSRLSHVLSWGDYPADVAVLYNAEAEWCGGRCETLQTTARTLDRAHIAFDVIWEDVLGEMNVRGGQAFLRGRTYRALAVPGSEYLPPDMLCRLERLAKEGLPVFVHGEKQIKSGGGTVAPVFRLAPGKELAGVLGNIVSDAGRLTVDGETPLIRYCRKVGGGGAGISESGGIGGGESVGADVGESGGVGAGIGESGGVGENGGVGADLGESEEALFICSQDDFRRTEFTLTLTDERPRRAYDAWENRFYAVRQSGRRVKIELPPSGAVLLVTDSRPADEYDYSSDANCRPADFVCENTSLIYPGGSVEVTDIAPGTDVTSVPGYENFHGVIRYEGRIEVRPGDRKLRITEAGEILSATLEGRFLGTMLGRDGVFDIRFASPGVRRLVLDVVNSPAYAMADGFSTFLPVPASGLTGDILIEQGE